MYTDGAFTAKHNKIGGWAAVATYGDKITTYSGYEIGTTSARMELLALVTALESLRVWSKRIHLITDSSYARDCVEKVPTWRGNGYVKADGVSCANPDLLERLHKTLTAHRVERAVTISWVKGHNGHPGNELADYLSVLEKQKAVMLDAFTKWREAGGAAVDFSPSVIHKASWGTSKSKTSKNVNAGKHTNKNVHAK